MPPTESATDHHGSARMQQWGMAPSEKDVGWQLQYLNRTRVKCAFKEKGKGLGVGGWGCVKKECPRSELWCEVLNGCEAVSNGFRESNANSHS